MMRLIVATMLAAAIAAPAVAQTQQSEFERYAIAVANPCLQSQPTPEGAADVLSKCEKASADLMTLKAPVPDVAGHDLNAFHIVRGSVFARLARSNMVLHGVNSRPVCDAMENAWTHFAAFKPADSPAYESMAKTLTDSSVAEIAACRAALGPSQAATPLPNG